MSQTRSADGASVLVERTAGLTAVLGAFVMASTVVFTITGTLGIHNVLVGAVIAVLGAVHALRTSTTRRPTLALAVILAVLGIWVAIAPIVLFDPQRQLVLGINGVSGALIVILSLAGVYGSFQTSDTAAASA
ncbi:SPW repeat domain-containing protein [Natrinema salaciae]|uniref:SPW repeat-containing integral membrane domain-containing protein n=1 Tax=Natrinema salaciae TaxID=1186196 RepID=A0A1H9CEH9_9EURY|nr:hypothetical protein [Natrinema salaciae]SEP99554.1 hypothetical protein SAMN04489841_1030 [Natrinema salaciae]